MVDIDVYSQYENYMKFQNCRPDYVIAVAKSLEQAKKYAGKKQDLILADFCCGTGNNTKKFADLIGGLRKCILIDINNGFLKIAKSSGINSKEIEIQNKDILMAPLKKECDLVFSIFAYHHIKDDKKQEYINQIKKSLKKGGILILTEIFLKNQEECLKYYDKLYSEIPEEKKISGLKEFLEQTAKSHDFEFKVTKIFADNQFEKNGFKKLKEIKIWPLDNSFDKERGTFVQVYTL